MARTLQVVSKHFETFVQEQSPHRKILGLEIIACFRKLLLDPGIIVKLILLKFVIFFQNLKITSTFIFNIPPKTYPLFVSSLQSAMLSKSFALM